MDPLHRQAIVQGLFGILVFVFLIFWPAGTFDYWQGWLFLGIFAAATVGFTVYLAIYDRPLLERRMKAGPQHEREWSQKIIVSLVLLAFFALIVVSALDHRYAWSPVAPGVSILGDVVILLSFLFISWVTRVNSFAASNIRVEKDQRVIDTGPYAHVRHPMYAGAIWLLAGMPLALGSWWSPSSCLSCPCFCGGCSTRREFCREIYPGIPNTGAGFAVVSFLSSGRGGLVVTCSQCAGDGRKVGSEPRQLERAVHAGDDSQYTQRAEAVGVAVRQVSRLGSDSELRAGSAARGDS
jgi:protein-S-isoprenylcysteine O-methyltransferase Ste14